MRYDKVRSDDIMCGKHTKDKTIKGKRRGVEEKSSEYKRRTEHTNKRK